MNYFNNFIVIDDDGINNKLCRLNIEKIYPQASIETFTDPRVGFDHIVTKYGPDQDNGNAILLLDISMPDINAWDFLEMFDKLNDTVKRRVKIYILSSSVDKSDMQRAHDNKYVEYYLIKPLTKESIHLMVHVLHRRLGLLEK